MRKSRLLTNVGLGSRMSTLKQKVATRTGTYPCFMWKIHGAFFSPWILKIIALAMSYCPYVASWGAKGLWLSVAYHKLGIHGFEPPKAEHMARGPQRTFSMWLDVTSILRWRFPFISGSLLKHKEATAIPSLLPEGLTSRMWPEVTYSWCQWLPAAFRGTRKPQGLPPPQNTSGQDQKSLEQTRNDPGDFWGGHSPVLNYWSARSGPLSYKYNYLRFWYPLVVLELI